MPASRVTYPGGIRSPDRRRRDFGNIPAYEGEETNKPLAEINNRLGEIRWSVVWLGVLVLLILFSMGWHR
jgi:hypothetical protein